MSYLKRPHHAIATAIGIAFLLMGCSSGSGDTVASVGPRPEMISERDIVEARSAFNSALADWERSGITDYTLEVGVNTIGKTRVVVSDKTVVSEESEGDADQWFNDPLPRTVEGLFAELDEMISLFEDDPSKLPEGDECGYHLNARLDPEIGYPTYYDTLGPCDDGVGLSAEIIVDGS